MGLQALSFIKREVVSKMIEEIRDEISGLRKRVDALRGYL
jgi:hypothetical protein